MAELQPATTNQDLELQTSHMFNRLQGDDGGIKARLVGSVALLAVGALIYGVLTQSPGQEIQEDQTEALGNVSSVKVVGLACEPLVGTDLSFKTRTKLELPGWIKSITRQDDLPASGFLTYVRDETGAEFSKGYYETLGCLPKTDVKVIDNLDTKTRQIDMDQSDMQLYTRKVADQTTLVFDSPALSSAGEILAKLSKLGSFGKFESFENYVNETKAKVGSTTEQMAENFVEQECFTAAYDTTKKIINIALIEQAKKDGFDLAPSDIKWTGAQPTFSGPYKLDGSNGSFQVEQDDYAISQCEVDPSLLDKSAAVEIEEDTPNLARGLEK